ncbi:MAG: AAA family ATPase [Epsilonproteobacteria bacterium]|nr:AAA family ATPase [Campylobacterota bacterium]|tara:strand:+ start:96 stop:875 length:780 start_codon:yes stop_codon:yes gene_type:complete
MNKKKDRVPHLDGPLLDKAVFNISKVATLEHYPFSLNIIQKINEITFPTNVTFLVGENGTGKSTILEALAYKAGFGLEGGSKNIHVTTSREETYTGAQRLADIITLSWRFKPKHGYFFRAESFFNIANHIDTLAQEDGKAYIAYGGKSLHEQSHGESFLSFFKHGLSKNSFFILDEPEAALSPQRQLSLMSIINDLTTTSQAQFIIATHSPILLAYPQATIYSCDTGVLEKIAYKETQHYKVTKEFLDNPERYLHYLFD